MCIPSLCLRAQTVLGSGEFGEVFKGIWETPYGPQEVAIKMLKKGSTDKQKATFLQEAAIMAQFRHPHIVRFLGAITVDEPVSDDIIYGSTISSTYPSYPCVVRAMHDSWSVWMHKLI